MIDANSSSPNKTVIIENANVDLDSDDSNVRILTVLDPVDLNQTTEDTNTTDQNLTDTGHGKESEEFPKKEILIKNKAPKRKIGNHKSSSKLLNIYSLFFINHILILQKDKVIYMKQIRTRVNQKQIQ